ncbi:MAG: xanthine dehydrogenase accessory factor [Arenicella sp.]|jgi:xanthine dehydrogenase accessory factor
MSLIYSQSEQRSELIHAAINTLSAGQRVALVTLVGIDGNAPYPVGSQMLVTEKGAYLGQITGGCAETAIADQAVESIKNAENTTLRYGLDSPFFDIRLPCGSGIDVYFDTSSTLENLAPIGLQLEQRLAYTQVLHTANGAFEKTYLPNARLILFGQGPILVLLAELAIKSGFDVACVAQNQHTDQLLESAGLKAVPLARARDEFMHELDQFSAMVSLFHEHELETQLLADALTTKAFYIGALGSKRTHAARLQSLKDHGVDAALFDRVRGPVGLDIGANTPAHIAVSILAEVIQRMNQRSV